MQLSRLVRHANKTGHKLQKAYFEICAIEVGIGVKNDALVDFEIEIFVVFYTLI